ncbi:MAG: DUF559 domain-containing protein [Alphaproteobacteria bacterium]|nr:DUF559 domain-containing protein [Alphaproteobacteria bacterium]
MKIPVNKSLHENARYLRKNSTLSEVVFWNAVKNKQVFGLDFNRQKIIGNYIVDFYCAKLQLVIEIDGSSHDNKQKYDANRDKYLKSLGLHILHLYEQDVRFDINGVIQMLCEYINTTFPKKTV